MTELLLQHGESVDVTDYKNQTLLHRWTDVTIEVE